MMAAYSQKDSANIQCREFSVDAITEGLHYKCAVIPSQWLKYEEKECKVELLLNHIYEITVFMQVSEHFKMCAHGHVRRSTVASGWQAGILLTCSLPICMWKIALPPIGLHEPCLLMAAKNYMSILKELKCVLCSNILSQLWNLHAVHSYAPSNTIISIVRTYVRTYERTSVRTYVRTYVRVTHLYTRPSAYWLLGMYAYLATNRNDHLPHKRRSQ